MSAPLHDCARCFGSGIVTTPRSTLRDGRHEVVMDMRDCVCTLPAEPVPARPEVGAACPSPPGAEGGGSMPPDLGAPVVSASARRLALCASLCGGSETHTSECPYYDDIVLPARAVPAGPDRFA